MWCCRSKQEQEKRKVVFVTVSLSLRLIFLIYGNNKDNEISLFCLHQTNIHSTYMWEVLENKMLRSSLFSIILEGWVDHSDLFVKCLKWYLSGFMNKWSIPFGVREIKRVQHDNEKVKCAIVILFLLVETLC